MTRLNATLVDNIGNLITTGYYTGIAVDFAGGGNVIVTGLSQQFCFWLAAPLALHAGHLRGEVLTVLERHLWSRSFG